MEVNATDTGRVTWQWQHGDCSTSGLHWFYTHSLYKEHIYSCDSK